MAEPKLEYTITNRVKVRQAIVDNLTPDLLPKKWHERNAANPLFGHCHNAAGAYQVIFGSKKIKLYRAKDDEGIYHWWGVGPEGEIFDPTRDQYIFEGRIPPPYQRGERASILGYDYRKRVNELVERVLSDLA